MRFMMMHRDPKSEAGIPPTKEFVARMGQLMGEMGQQGVLLAGEGVHPSSKGMRLSYHDGQATVTDGPFTESKEIIAGFAILDVPSREDAIAWATRFAELFGDVELELRPVVEVADLMEWIQSS